MKSLDYTLFTQVNNFYQNLLDAVHSAEQSIHMIYFAFDHGQWADRISQALQEKARSGVEVHLMVDAIGMTFDNLRNAWRNRALLAKLRSAGVEVVVFRPTGQRLSRYNRLHAKVCTVDQRTVFLGGSNIGDHYLGWRDSNLRLDGDFGDTFDQLYACLRQFSSGFEREEFVSPALHVADVPLVLTVPGHRQDIRRALLNLILEAERSVTLRSWYFLPDREILNALHSQAEQGVEINIMFSHRTRMPFIDVLNRMIGSRLARSGVKIHRYQSSYMHGKEAWNDKGHVLFGSANIDIWALGSNFECNLQLHHQPLADHLQQLFTADLPHCQRQSTISDSQPRSLERHMLPRPLTEQVSIGVSGAGGAQQLALVTGGEQHG